jgi:hypothetical protein
LSNVDPNEALKKLLGNLKDTDAAQVWGKSADEAAERQANQPRWWKRNLGPIEGTVTKVDKRMNFTGERENPVLEVTGDDGKLWKWEITTWQFEQIAREKLVQKGDHIKQVLGKREGKSYKGDDLIVTRDGVEVKSAVEEAAEVPF